MILKILLPVFEDSSSYMEAQGRFTPTLWPQIQKAGVPYHLFTYVNRGAEREGELPARNRLFRWALQDNDWKYCVTLSNDILTLPENWGRDLVNMMDSLPPDVGALAPYIIPDDIDWPTVLTPDLVPYIEFSTAFTIIKREVLEKVGLLDEGFGMGGGMEHIDYVIRMYQNGFSNLATRKVTTRNAITFGNNFPVNPETYVYFAKKYGTQFDGLPAEEFVKRARALHSNSII